MQRALLVLLLALLVGATACGGAGKSVSSATTAAAREGSAQQAVLAAASKAGALKSGRVSFTAKLTGGVTGGTFTGEGVFADKRARMSMDMSGLAGGGLGGGQMEMVFENLVLYMKFPPALARELPAGKTWIKFDLAELGKAQGIDFAALFDQASGSDPTKTLQFLRAAQDDFRRVGTEEVRGVETTHYSGTVDLAVLAEKSPPAVRESYRRAIELSGQSRVPVEVWLDDQGRTRRMRYEQKMAGGSTMELTQEYFDFGTDVEVTPPPAREVIDVTQLIANA